MAPHVPTLTLSPLRSFLSRTPSVPPTFTLFISRDVQSPRHPSSSSLSSSSSSSSSPSSSLLLPGSLRPAGDVVQSPVPHLPSYVRATSSLLSIERSAFNRSGNKAFVYVPLVTAEQPAGQQSLGEVLPTFSDVGKIVSGLTRVSTLPKAAPFFFPQSSPSSTTTTTTTTSSSLPVSRFTVIAAGDCGSLDLARSVATALRLSAGGASTHEAACRLHSPAGADFFRAPVFLDDDDKTKTKKKAPQQEEEQQLYQLPVPPSTTPTHLILFPTSLSSLASSLSPFTPGGSLFNVSTTPDGKGGMKESDDGDEGAHYPLSSFGDCDGADGSAVVDVVLDAKALKTESVKAEQEAWRRRNSRGGGGGEGGGSLLPPPPSLLATFAASTAALILDAQQRDDGKNYSYPSPAVDDKLLESLAGRASDVLRSLLRHCASKTEPQEQELGRLFDETLEMAKARAAMHSNGSLVVRRVAAVAGDGVFAAGGGGSLSRPRSLPLHLGASLPVLHFGGCHGLFPPASGTSANAGFGGLEAADVLVASLASAYGELAEENDETTTRATTTTTMTMSKKLGPLVKDAVKEGLVPRLAALCKGGGDGVEKMLDDVEDSYEDMKDFGRGAANNFHDGGLVGEKSGGVRDLLTRAMKA